MKNSINKIVNESTVLKSRTAASIWHHLRGGAATVGILASVWLMSGCLNPGSKGYDDSKHVWTSPRSLPQTVQLVDTRDDSVLWAMEVPAGKWLVTKLLDGQATGDDPDHPDRLKYRVIKADSVWTTLTNSIDVPPAEFRRWELTLREPAAVVAGPQSNPNKIPMIELPAPNQGDANDPTLESIDLNEDG